MDPEDLSTTFINKIPQSTSFEPFIFQTKWQSDTISLQIVDTNESKEWQAGISLDELKQSAEELEIPYDKFFEECKDALTRNGGVDHFQYSVEDNKFILTKNDKFQIQYLEVPLRSSFDVQNSIILTATDLIASLRGELTAVGQQSKGLDEKYQTMVKTREKCLQEKDEIERKLLRKFAILLNSKKDKIAELQDLLLEKSKKLEEAGISVEHASKRSSTEMMGDSVDRGDDDFMVSTQVMTQPVVALPKRRKFNPSDEDVVPKKSLTKEIEKLNVNAEEESADPTVGGDIQDSPDIFDQL